METSCGIMNELSQKLDICTSLIQGSVAYLDYPVYQNVGDLLIWLGAKELLERNHAQVVGSYSYRAGRFANNAIDRCSTICFQGGGNMGDLYPQHQMFRERIIQRCPSKRIIILPQSVHYQNEQELIKTCNTYKRHSDLHIFLRDKKSYALLAAQEVPNIYLCPDTAHALWTKLKAQQHENNENLLLLRRDVEKSFLPESLRTQQSNAFDWDDFIRTGTDASLYKVVMLLFRIDARLLGNALPFDLIWERMAQRLVKKAVQLFSSHKTVVTNRLHAMILAALLEKRAIVYDNSYGKVSSYYDLWLKDIPSIAFNKMEQVS